MSSASIYLHQTQTEKKQQHEGRADLSSQPSIRENQFTDQPQADHAILKESIATLTAAPRLESGEVASQSRTACLSDSETKVEPWTWTLDGLNITTADKVVSRSIWISMCVVCT